MTLNWHLAVELRLPSPESCHRHVYAFQPALILDAHTPFNLRLGHIHV